MQSGHVLAPWALCLWLRKEFRNSKRKNMFSKQSKEHKQVPVQLQLWTVQRQRAHQKSGRCLKRREEFDRNSSLFPNKNLNSRQQVASFPLFPPLQHAGGPQQHCSLSSEQGACQFIPFGGQKATAALYPSERPRQNRQAEPHSSARCCHGDELLPGSLPLREDWELARPKNKDVGLFFLDVHV